MGRADRAGEVDDAAGLRRAQAAEPESVRRRSRQVSHRARARSRNVRLAQMLASALNANINSRWRPADSVLLRGALDECESLCARFPDDPLLHVIRAGMLFHSGRSTDANAALDRAQSLGGDIIDLAGAQGVGAVRDAARRETQQRLTKRALCGGLIF